MYEQHISAVKLTGFRMVAAITGINLPSLVSENMPNEAVQQQLLKHTSDKAYSRDAVTVAISKSAASMLATLKGETLPAVAVELHAQVRNPGGKKQNPYKKKQKPTSDDDGSSTDPAEASDEKTIRGLESRNAEVKANEQQQISSSGPVPGNPEATIQTQMLMLSASSVADYSGANKSATLNSSATEESAKSELAEKTQKKNKRTSSYNPSVLEAYNSLNYRISPGYMVNAVA